MTVPAPPPPTTEQESTAQRLSRMGSSGHVKVGWKEGKTA